MVLMRCYSSDKTIDIIADVSTLIYFQAIYVIFNSTRLLLIIGNILYILYT